MKKFLSVVLVLLMLACVFPISSFAANITSVEANGIDIPLVGRKPDLTASVVNASNYAIENVSWSEYDAGWDWQRDLEDNDTFREGYIYVVFVQFKVIGNNTFDTSATGKINGKQVNKYTPSGDKKSFTIYTFFDACKKPIDKVELSVVTPVVGKTPTFTKVNTSSYESVNSPQNIPNQTNGVYWTNQKTGVNLSISNAFQADGIYTVGYGLSAKDGYAFAPDMKATINGKEATVEVAADVNGNIVYVYVELKNIVPDDGKKSLSNIEITVTAPKDGEQPSFTKIDGNGYYSNNSSNPVAIYKNGIAWYKSTTSYIGPSTTEKFIGGNNYTVKIYLVPKDGYKFADSITVTINGIAATVDKFDDGICAYVTLTALNKEHSHIDSDWRCDNDFHWKVCIDENCGAITVPKTEHVDENGDQICDVCNNTPDFVLNGWVENDGKWAYYVDGIKLFNRWQKDSNGWCYLDSDGYMATNKWIKDSQGWCYVGANGYCVTNTWKKDSKGWCYLDANGRMATNKWIKDSQGWCYVGANGYCVTNKWVKDSKGWVYLDNNGRMVTNKWVKDSKGWCYVGADGYAVTNCWKKDSVGWCYLDEEGSMTKNEWVKDGGKWYYLDGNGYMVTGTKVIGGKTYKFNLSGVCLNK